MLMPRLCEDGPDAGKWFMVASEAGAEAGRRAGFCARHCAGHATAEEALAHHREYQLDQEVELGLERRSSPSRCEVCGEVTTLRAQVGRATPLLVLCWAHQSATNLRDALRRRDARTETAQA